MKVTILGDLGPCFGVERAIDEAIDIHRSFPYSKIYFPHPMVHNQRTNDLVKEKTGQNYFTIDETALRDPDVYVGALMYPSA